MDYDEEEDDVLDIHPNEETMAEFDAHEATQTHPSLTPLTVQSYGVQPSIPLHLTDSTQFAARLGETIDQDAWSYQKRTW